MRAAAGLALLALAFVAGACAGPSDPPTAAAGPSAPIPAPDAAAAEPLGRAESLTTLLALLEEGKETCLRLAVERREALTWNDPAESRQQFLAGTSVWDAFRGGALARASAELRMDERYTRPLTGEDLLWLPGATDTVETLCERLTDALDLRSLDRLIEHEVAEYEFCVRHLPQHPVAAGVRRDVVDRHADLVQRHYDELSRRLRAERETEAMWRETHRPEPLDAEERRRQQAEYRRWLAAGEQREKEEREQAEAREAHLAQRRGKEHDVGRLPILGNEAGSAERVDGLSRLAIRGWHQTYRQRSAAFHDERRRYEQAVHRRSPRRHICTRLEEVARAALTDPETLSCPDPEVRRSFQVAVRSYLEAARHCLQGEAAEEAELAAAGARHLVRAVTALEGYGLEAAGDDLHRRPPR